MTHRTFVIFAAGVMSLGLVSSSAGAANGPRQELRQDRRAIHRDLRELRYDRMTGDRAQYREDRRELREDRAEYREDRQEWRKDLRARCESGDCPRRKLTDEERAKIRQRFEAYKTKHPDATPQEFRQYVRQQRQERWQQFQDNHPGATRDDFRRMRLQRMQDRKNSGE